jgi:hypothetical protein
VVDIKEKINGRFNPKKLETLKQIVQSDYGVDLSDDELEDFGWMLLKITRLARSVFDRTGKVIQ